MAKNSYKQIKRQEAEFHAAEADALRLCMLRSKWQKRRRQLLQALEHEITTAHRERKKAFAELEGRLD